MVKRLGLMGRLRAAVRGPVMVQEAYHPDVRNDSDDAFFRGARAWDRVRAVEFCRYLYLRNPMAHRVIGLDVDFVVGDTFSWSVDLNDEARQDEAQRELERWALWTGADSLWWQEMITRYWIDGELVLKVVGPPERLRFIPIDPLNLKVETDADTLDPVYIVQPQSGRKDKRYRILNTPSPAAPLPSMGGEDTEDDRVLYFRHDTAIMDGRGTPEMLAIAVRLGWEEETTVLGVKRAKSMLRWFWNVILNGATQAEIDDYQKKYAQAPPTGSVRYTNEKAEWKVVSADLAAYEVTNFQRNLRGGIAGAAGHPQHWHGDGGDANLATATAMSEPARRRMARLQGEVRSIAEWMLYTVLEGLVEAKRVGVVDLEMVSWSIDLPDTDPVQYETATVSAAAGLETLARAEELGYITWEAAQRSALQALNTTLRLGLTERDKGAQPESDPYLRNPPPKVAAGVADGDQDQVH